MPSPRKLPPGRTVGAPLPIASEQALHRALQPMIADVRATLPRVKTEADARALGAALRRRWSDAKISELLRGVGAKVESAASLPWRTVAKKADALRASKGDRMDAKKPKSPLADAPEYDGEALVKSWVDQASSLITSVRDEIVPTLQADIVHAVEHGIDPADLAAKWIAQGVPVQFGTLVGRMKVIAQHQITTLNSNVQRARAQSVGVRDFVWRSRGDSRVRPLHRQLDGQRFSYADPSTSGEGLPGHPVNCRCWAESVIPDEMVSALGLGAVFER